MSQFLLKRKNFHKILSKYKIERKLLSSFFEIFHLLSPNPLQELANTIEPDRIVPDVYVKQYGKEFVVEVNDTPLPILRLNLYYKNLFTKIKDTEPSYTFFRNKYYAAQWLMYAIEQRRLTIIKITNSS